MKTPRGKQYYRPQVIADVANMPVVCMLPMEQLLVFVVLLPTGGYEWYNLCKLSPELLEECPDIGWVRFDNTYYQADMEECSGFTSGFPTIQLALDDARAVSDSKV